MKLAAVVALLCLSLLAPAAASAADPEPRTGRSVVVKPTKGAVFVQKRGSSKRTRLRGAKAVPMGTTIDARRGSVKLTSTANRRGTRRQSAVFYDGAFRVTQNRQARPLTDLQLVGGDFAACGSAVKPAGVFASRARRRLWGRGRGRFRTRGRNGSATVRGTTWRTEDSCAGTETFARSGSVQTNAAGADLERLLEPGQSIIYYCNTNGIQGVAGLYCVLVLSQPATGPDQPWDLVGFGIATAGSPHNTYRLCVRASGLQDDCGEFPMSGPDEDGVRAGGVGCVIGQPNSYSAAWSIAGTQLPVPLPFRTTTPASESGCVSDPPRPGIDPAPSARIADPKLRSARAAAR